MAAARRRVERRAQRTQEHREAGGEPEYARLRIGIKPLETDRPTVPLDAFVLAPFAAAEREATMALFSTLVEVAERWVHDGVTAAMHLQTRTTTTDGDVSR